MFLGSTPVRKVRLCRGNSLAAVQSQHSPQPSLWEVSPTLKQDGWAFIFLSLDAYFLRREHGLGQCSFGREQLPERPGRTAVGYFSVKSGWYRTAPITDGQVGGWVAVTAHLIREATTAPATCSRLWFFFLLELIYFQDSRDARCENQCWIWSVVLV